MKQMKICVGLGSIDDYPDYVRAGADEVFIGYVPSSYATSYGRRRSPNRREVIYVNVQAGSMSELLILKDMVREYKKPVSIAFNSLSYTEEERNALVRTMSDLSGIGFSQFILAEPELIEKRKESGIPAEITVSGELGEMNPGLLEYVAETGAKRIIFPRQTAIPEMKRLIAMRPDLEYEAFVLNEKCHYTGAYCMSLHCDELPPLCRVPYRLDGKVTETENTDFEGVGAGGCGLCALWDLREAGVTHLKIVSRGNGSDRTLMDIRTLKRALDILEKSSCQEEFCTKMKEEIYPNGCGQNCYFS